MHMLPIAAAASCPENILAFHAPLTSNILTRKGSGTATFTRATTGTFPDFESILRTAIAGEPRFRGGRMVRNVVPKNVAAWDTLASAPTSTTEIAPDGTATAFKLTSGAGTYWAHSISGASAIPGSIRTAIWIKRVTGTGTISMYNGGPVSATENITSVVTTAWQRITTAVATFDLSAASYCGISLATAGDEVLVWHGTADFVSGASNQSPQEWIDSTVDYGAGVVGVKYQETTNGNSVASSVVTEATGAAIPAATLKGILLEVARTNLLFHSSDASGWAANSATPSNSADVTNPRGAAQSIKLLENTGNVQQGAYTPGGINVAVGASTVTTWSIELHGGLGRTWGWVDAYDSAGSHVSYFDLGGGVVGSNAAGNTNVMRALGNGWYRCSVTRTTGTANVAVLQFGPSTGDGVNSYAGDAAKGIYGVDAQIESGAYASSEIETTTVAVTRNADVLSAPTAGNIAAAAGTVALTFTPETADTGTRALFLTYVDASNYLSIFFGSGSISLNKRIGGVDHTASASLTIVAGTSYRIAARWGAGGQDIFVDGVKGTNESNADPAQIASTMSLGGFAPSLTGYQCGGSIKNVRTWLSALTAQQIGGIAA